MSFALIRNDLLVDLANEGEAATEHVQERVEELLGKAPGAWLPDGYEASYQLVERAIKRANKSGKITLIKAARRVLNEFGRAWTFKKLSLGESRQFLGAAILVADHPTLIPKNSMDLAVPLHMARERPVQFWERVSAAKEIVGHRKEHKAKMLDSLWNRLPADSRSLIVSAEARSLKTEKHEAVKFRQMITRPAPQKKTPELLVAEAIARRLPILFEASFLPSNPDAITWVLFERVSSVGSILTVAKAMEELPSHQVHPVNLKITMPLRGTDHYAVANAIFTRVEVIQHQFCSGKNGEHIRAQYNTTPSVRLDHLMLALIAA